MSVKYMLQLNLFEFLGILKVIWLLVALIAFFLNLWIIVPAPNSLFLYLSVGTPEISLWLIVIQGISLIIGLINFHSNVFSYVIISCNLIGLGLSLLPLVQFAKVNARLKAEMEAQRGKNYLNFIPDSLKAKMRRKPLILTDLFRGIPLETVRIERGISFAQLDGIDLTLNVYKPLSVGKYPSIIVIYGGGWQNGSPLTKMKTLVVIWPIRVILSLRSIIVTLLNIVFLLN